MVTICSKWTFNQLSLSDSTNGSSPQKKKKNMLVCLSVLVINYIQHHLIPKYYFKPYYPILALGIEVPGRQVLGEVTWLVHRDLTGTWNGVWYTAGAQAEHRVQSVDSGAQWPSLDSQFPHL